MKAGLPDLHAVFVSLYPPTNSWLPELIFMKLGMYIIAPEPYLKGVLHESHPSVCVSIYVFSYRC
jgi:hypothetical protein